MISYWQFIAIAALFALLGCIQTADSFELGSPFTISENQTLSNSGANMTIKAISFENSLCPFGVTCIWSGELGVNLQVNGDMIYLGTQTKPSAEYMKYNIELLSINYDARIATVKVTGVA